MKFYSLMLLLFTVLSVGGCKPEAENIFTMFDDLKVTFHERGNNSVTDYKLLNDGDSVYLHFTVTSEDQDMYTVVVDSTRGNGQVNERRIVLKPNERRSYSGTIGHKMNRDGKLTFRISALNEQGVYLGDGYTSVTVEGAPSMTVFADRRVYVANANNGFNLPSFYSIDQAKAFDYDNGLANSADIDFGLFILPAADLSACFNIYSIAGSYRPIAQFDFTGWEPRSTLFSAPIQAGLNTFRDVLSSSSMIETEAKKRTINLTHTEYVVPDNAVNPGNLLYFLTPEGKYGALYVNQVSEDLDGKIYLSISTKIQR